MNGTEEGRLSWFLSQPGQRNERDGNLPGFPIRGCYAFMNGEAVTAFTLH